ncbi:hypothetical protein [Gemmatimonas phototrophica]|nr:hypothetical protein [Gemmatimonas phototrophica]
MSSLRSCPSARRSRTHVLTTMLAPLAVSLLAGCYSYRPLANTSVPARTDLRLYFTADGARSLRDAAGFELRQLDGVAVRTLADSAVVVRPSTVLTVDGNELPWRRGELVVPWRTVERSQQRTMDKRRTRGFAAVMGAVFTGVVYFALKSISGGSGATLQSGGGVPE